MNATVELDLQDKATLGGGRSQNMERDGGRRWMTYQSVVVGADDHAFSDAGGLGRDVDRYDIAELHVRRQ